MSEVYAELRPRAFAIAYRMLGSVSEAEDIVQEAFLRMHQTEEITSPRAFVATLVTRLSIDQLRSARVRRERYVGEWLPEPVLSEPSPADQAETADSLSLAFLVLLESLSPRQRAAFLLREVFDYPYPEVAEIVGTDVDTTRHLVAKARHHVKERRPRYPASRQQRQELAERFTAAASRGDLAALEALLADDVALHADGGGRVPALGRAVDGRHRVARTIAVGFRKIAERGLRVKIAEVNGQPGFVTVDADDRLIMVMGMDVADGRIRALHSIVNPDKLP
ncbi:RNA polymerase sigma-70 factor [Asanoa iriomotensis]|uniref:DNA-directed RNA polymerase sigma-70 factor n=1 Tax=Asanoa iriomotensis TaxID=234613 RepID=A0ABQ4C1S1_9ACTN|nr:RNA polymerase sigma-70 factor [Asanoa iriomotensis]GIF56732.1 DNA-directed RNA polymerase sigma-70 factor [Asanoa iriomotensis]